VLGQALSQNNKETDKDELLMVITPHVILERTPASNLWINVPMNVPK
jgi:Flp pilus assembly secretin CpaC